MPQLGADVVSAAGRVFVVGAGPAGLSAAHHLGGDVELFEAKPYIGGHCRTKTVDGFCFDEGAHVFFGTDDCSRRFVLEPLAAELVHHRADVWNDYGSGRFGRYPVQVNLHALSPELASRCLLGFIEAWHSPESTPQDYEAWCRAAFGDTMAEEFMLRYARKIWTVPPSELNTEWLGSSVGGRVIRPELDQVVRGAIDPSPQNLNYYTEFHYPRAGGFQRILGPIASELTAVRLSCGVTRIDVGRRCLELADGTSRAYEVLVSSVPLPALLPLIADAPADVVAAGERLTWTAVRFVSFGMDRRQIGPGHWVYFYDEEVPFFRASFPSKFAPGNAPPGTSSVTCEVAYSRRQPLDDRNLVDRCRDALIRERILDASDRILVQDVMDAPFGYVIFDAARRPSLDVIHGWLERSGILACGRFGDWGYHWSFDALESGRRAASRARALLVE